MRAKSAAVSILLAAALLGVAALAWRSLERLT
jgi:hypothetical protein